MVLSLGFICNISIDNVDSLLPLFLGCANSIREQKQNLESVLRTLQKLLHSITKSKPTVKFHFTIPFSGECADQLPVMFLTLSLLCFVLVLACAFNNNFHRTKNFEFSCGFRFFFSFLGGPFGFSIVFLRFSRGPCVFFIVTRTPQ